MSDEDLREVWSVLLRPMQDSGLDDTHDDAEFPWFANDDSNTGVDVRDLVKALEAAGWRLVRA
ncbi:MAG TPA: type II toxin-antitoxin system HicA family toxin [Thermomicrobiales bacterium]|nr:type II toxin-antitoxin system HicA family toxin [Thermomicrobiales bacterium]